MNLAYKIKRICSMVMTKYLLWSNHVICQRYRIVGTPYIETSGDGKILLGNNFIMNNGMMANQIGLNTPCAFRAEEGSIME